MKSLKLLKLLVYVTGFEPATSCTPSMKGCFSSTFLSTQNHAEIPYYQGFPAFRKVSIGLNEYQAISMLSGTKLGLGLFFKTKLKSKLYVRGDDGAVYKRVG